ncbi:hypothetical protein [Lacticaseibacillus suibinensis]|uniref:hypothetical protein n=1 Tax=Lacticaseibacillus suibinensis TaxID=2486011 RepID=UPI000F7B85BB|nr:hypothetical protein [Lacticaseibacillus suibinensis]
MARLQAHRKMLSIITAVTSLVLLELTLLTVIPLPFPTPDITSTEQIMTFQWAPRLGTAAFVALAGSLLLFFLSLTLFRPRLAKATGFAGVILTLALTLMLTPTLTSFDGVVTGNDFSTITVKLTDAHMTGKVFSLEQPGKTRPANLSIGTPVTVKTWIIFPVFKHSSFQPRAIMVR